MKNTVIEFFQNLPENKPEQFNKAFELYRQSPGKSESAERVINTMGFSDSALNNLLYDLQKLHGITDVEKLPIQKPAQNTDLRLQVLERVVGLDRSLFPQWLAALKDSGYQILELLVLANETENDLAILALSEISIYKDKVDTLEYIVNTTIEEMSKDFTVLSPKIEDLQACLEFAVEVKNELAEQKIKDIIDLRNVSPSMEEISLDEAFVKNSELENENEELVNKNEELEEENEELRIQLDEAKKMPKINAESLRVEFPFLNEKDCPNELKILVSDKITIWNEYLTLHEEITQAQSGQLSLTPEELEQKAKRSIECFDENQKIYDELNTYKETGKVLGKHKIFKTLQLSREVETMTPEELYNYKGSTSKFFSDKKKDLKAAEKLNDQVKIEEIKEKMALRQEKLDLVNKKLGIKK